MVDKYTAFTDYEWDEAGQYLAECIPSLVEENVAYRRVLFLAFSQRDTFHLTTEFGLEGDGLLKLKSIFEDSNN